MPLRPPVSENDHLQGNKNAPIELLEYGDYQCPFCGMAYPIVKQLQSALGEKLKFIFRNFPLAKVHPQATISAIASEAAGLQGKFWEMHDMLFENQRHLNKTALSGYARELGLNLNQFEEDMLNEALAEKVEAHFYSGLRSGVNATPTFYINGEKYDQSWGKDELLGFIKNKYAALFKN
jgi:protein-disulfide isomerase